MEALSVDERATMTNMAAEVGAFTGIIPADEKSVDFMVNERGMDRARAEALVEGMQSDPDAEYVKVIEIDASTIRPMAALPNDPGNGVFIDELGDEPIRIDIAYAGSCTAGKKEDMDMYAAVVRKAVDKGMSSAADALTSIGNRGGNGRDATSSTTRSSASGTTSRARCRCSRPTSAPAGGCATRSTSARSSRSEWMCFGPSPQQPPTTCAPFSINSPATPPRSVVSPLPVPAVSRFVFPQAAATSRAAVMKANRMPPTTGIGMLLLRNRATYRLLKAPITSIRIAMTSRLRH